MRYMLNISEEEKQALLNQHSKPYDGYQTLRFPEPDNRIHTYDPAGDKGCITVNNRGEIKSYTNVGINESMGEKCECGGNMYEGECMECGYKAGGPVAEPHYGSFDYVENKMCECGGMYNEGVCNECGASYMEEETGHLDDIYNVRDLNLKKGDFDYVEGGGNDYGTFEGMHKNLYEDEDYDNGFGEEDED